MRDMDDFELGERVAESIYGSVENYEEALKHNAPHALALRRGLAVRLQTRDRVAAEKAFHDLADQLENSLGDLDTDLLPEGLLKEAEEFAGKLRAWKDEGLHELLHDLTRALSSEGSDKVKAARVESLTRAVREAIEFQPESKPATDKKSPDTKQPETVGDKFRKHMAPA